MFNNFNITLQYHHEIYLDRHTALAELRRLVIMVMLLQFKETFDVREYGGTISKRYSLVHSFDAKPRI